MFHKTLESYHLNQPWDKTEEHPDGPLWLMTWKEYLDLPLGVELHSVSGRCVIKGSDDVESWNMPGTNRLIWGIRGRREQ
jgi:hypothetical protein